MVGPDSAELCCFAGRPGRGPPPARAQANSAGPGVTPAQGYRAQPEAGIACTAGGRRSLG